jgi:hypothetical protein
MLRMTFSPWNFLCVGPLGGAWLERDGWNQRASSLRSGGGESDLIATCAIGEQKTPKLWAPPVAIDLCKIGMANGSYPLFELPDQGAKIPGSGEKIPGSGEKVPSSGGKIPVPRKTGNSSSGHCSRRLIGPTGDWGELRAQPLPSWPSPDLIQVVMHGLDPCIPAQWRRDNPWRLTDLIAASRLLDARLKAGQDALDHSRGSCIVMHGHDLDKPGHDDFTPARVLNSWLDCCVHLLIRFMGKSASGTAQPLLNHCILSVGSPDCGPTPRPMASNPSRT